MTRIRWMFASVVALVAAALIACGGGGSSDPSDPPATGTPSVTGNPDVTPSVTPPSMQGVTPALHVEDAGEHLAVQVNCTPVRNAVAYIPVRQNGEFIRFPAVTDPAFDDTVEKTMAVEHGLSYGFIPVAADGTEGEPSEMVAVPEPTPQDTHHYCTAVECMSDVAAFITATGWKITRINPLGDQEEGFTVYTVYFVLTDASNFRFMVAARPLNDDGVPIDAYLDPQDSQFSLGRPTDPINLGYGSERNLLRVTFSNFDTVTHTFDGVEYDSSTRTYNVVWIVEPTDIQ